MYTDWIFNNVKELLIIIGFFWGVTVILLLCFKNICIQDVFTDEITSK